MLRALEPANGEAILPLADLKARIRQIDDAEDADIGRMRDQAIDWVERFTGIALLQRQFEYADRQFCRRIMLPVGPIASVDAIAYDDSLGGEVELTSTDWRFGAGAVMSGAGTLWPMSIGDPGSVRITFTAGLENAEEEAPLLIAAVCVAVAAMFADRENPDFTAAMNVASSYRMPGL
jgi:uncharacterized phiE125 gp8 family phage protein